MPGRFKGDPARQGELSCRCCETVHKAPSPDLPTNRGRPGPGLLVTCW
jgi:transposase